MDLAGFILPLGATHASEWGSKAVLDCWIDSHCNPFARRRTRATERPSP